MMGLYERIKEVDNRKGYSINRLEKELGFPRSSISKYNKNVPSMEKIQKIADLLNVSIDQIIGEERDNTNKYYINEETAKTAQEMIIKKPIKQSRKTLIQYQKTKSRNKQRKQMIQNYLKANG